MHTSRYSAALFALLSTSVLADYDSPYNKIEKPYSADMVYYNERSPKVSKTVRVSHGKGGIRIEDSDTFNGRNKSLFIQNFISDTAWVARPDHRVFAKLPKEDSDSEGAEVNEHDFGGVMGTKPCASAPNIEVEKRMSGKTSLNGEEVVIWKCKINSYEVKQYYSNYWLMVVREELPGLDITELRNIKEVNFPDEFFTPSDNYREITLEEFYMGTPKLGPYQDK